MSRVIKFRGWNDKEKVMITPSHTDTSIINGELVQNNGPRMNDYIIYMQFTGLHDKEGKEIYEGDIVTWGYGNVAVRMGAIEVDDDYPPGMGTGWVTDDCFVDSNCKVIGNIHLNPELLGEVK